MYKQPSGAPPAVKTAYTVPFDNEQKLAWPLVKAGLSQFNLPSELVEKFVVMKPGVSDGRKG